MIEFGAQLQLLRELESREERIVRRLKDVHRVGNGSVDVDDVGGGCWTSFVLSVNEGILQLDFKQSEFTQD